MELRWYITSKQEIPNGPYYETRVLQFRPSSNYEWQNVDHEYGSEIRFDGTERGSASE